MSAFTCPRANGRHGRFVPNITIGPLVVRAVRAATRLPLDVHLMIVEPERYLRDFFSGHFAVDDAVFVNAELANARIDPRLAQLLDRQAESYATALATVRDLGAAARASEASESMNTAPPIAPPTKEGT